MHDALFDCGLTTEDSVAIPLSGVEVKCDITGRAAKLKVRQRFFNGGDKPVEAVYRFPLPESSSVCGFRAVIGDRVFKGGIEERNEAFKIYDEALSKGHGAYLLDEERPNIFTLSLGNLNPKNSAIIEIDYVMLLDANGSEVRFLLPTTISPRYVPENISGKDGIPVEHILHPVYDPEVPYGLSIHLDIHGREQIAAIESPSHSIITQFSQDPIAVEFSAQTAAMDRDFILNIHYVEEFQNRAFYWAEGNDKFVQLDFSPKLDSSDNAGNGNVPEIIFVLDCSGSMQGSSITEAKRVLDVFLKGLAKETYFNIYRFGSTFTKLFRTSEPYDKKTLKKAVDFLSAVDADLGGTEMLSPLYDIYGTAAKHGNHRSILLITDGEVANEEEISGMVKRQSDGTSLFTVGIGYGPNEYLIKQLARASGGASECIAPGERIEPKVLRLFKKVTSGRLDNFRIQWGTDVDQAPTRAIAYNGEPISIFAKLEDSMTRSNKIKICGDLMHRRWEWLVDINIVQGTDIPVPLLWARERIRELEEGTIDTAGSKQLERKDKSIKEKIVTLSKKYSLISRESSFVVVEKRPDSRKTSGEVVFTKIPVLLTKNWHGDMPWSRSVGMHGASSIRPDDLKRVLASAQQSVMLADRRLLHCIPRSYALDNQGKIKGPVAFHGFRLDVDTKIMHSVLGINSTFHEKKRYGVVDTTKEQRPHGVVAIPHKDLVMYDILASQQAGGGFAIDITLADTLGLSFANLQSIAQKIKTKGKSNNWILLSTAIILYVLEKEFSKQRSSWDNVIQKSKKWFEIEVVRVKPSVEGEPLSKWVKKYVDKTSIELKTRLRIG